MSLVLSLGGMFIHKFYKKHDSGRAFQGCSECCGFSRPVVVRKGFVFLAGVTSDCSLRSLRELTETDVKIGFIVSFRYNRCDGLALSGFLGKFIRKDHVKFGVGRIVSATSRALDVFQGRVSFGYFL